MKCKCKLKIGNRFRSFKSLTDAARYFRIPVVPVYARVRNGWTKRKALMTPLRSYRIPPYKPNQEIATFKIGKVATVSNARH